MLAGGMLKVVNSQLERTGIALEGFRKLFIEAFKFFANRFFYFIFYIHSTERCAKVTKTARVSTLFRTFTQVYHSKTC